MESIIGKAKRGDKHALRKLFSMHRNLIESVVARFLREREVWEDVVQTIMLKVVTSIGDFRETCLFSTWLYRIAVNECMEWNRRCACRKEKCFVTHDEVDIFPDPDAPDGLAHTIREELHKALRDIIAGLPTGMKQAVGFFYEKGYTGAEAARELNITERALFVRLSDARKKLKRELVSRGFVV